MFVHQRANVSLGTAGKVTGDIFDAMIRFGVEKINRIVRGRKMALPLVQRGFGMRYATKIKAKTQVKRAKRQT